MFGVADLLTTVVPALLPVAADGVRGLVNKFTGGAGMQPANVAEAIQLMEANTKRLSALAALDAPTGNISGWVADLRASSRYIAALGVVVYGCLYSALGTDLVAINDARDFAQAGFFFLFGDRVYTHLRKGG